MSEVNISAANQSSYDPERLLPAGKEWFSVPFLSTLWGCDPKHVHALIDKGAIKWSASLHTQGATKSMRRIPRAAIVAFLNSRENQ
jgi:hypothetical protein